jgi:hypothetical protein
MKIYNLTTTEAVEFRIGCDNLKDDGRSGMLIALIGGNPVQSFERSSILCWEEVEIMETAQEYPPSPFLENASREALTTSIASRQ